MMSWRTKVDGHHDDFKKSTAISKGYNVGLRYIKVDGHHDDLRKKFINYKEFFHTHAHTNGTFVK